MTSTDKHGNATRTVPAWNGDPDAPRVTVTRLTGTGPRRYGDTYKATTADGRTLGVATFVGRKGGMDTWSVLVGAGRTSYLYGSLAFLTQQYGQDVRRNPEDY